jgi:hypothetical protein
VVNAHGEVSQQRWNAAVDGARAWATAITGRDGIASLARIANARIAWNAASA